MDFSFTNEQQMLQEATRRYLQKALPFDTRRVLLQNSGGHAAEIWQGLAGLGLLALNVPVEFDGLGGDAIDTMLVMQSIGEHLLPAPFITSAVQASCAIDALGTLAQRAQWLPAMARGEIITVLAHDELATQDDRLAVATVAQRSDTGFVLNGHKCVIPHAMHADWLIVSARLHSAEGSVALFMVPRAAPGLQTLPCPLVDGTLAADIILENLMLAPEALLGSETSAADVLSMVLDRGIAALCAEAMGALDKLLAATAEYTRTRKQFGVEIASFQALRHRLAEMLMHVEQARSMAYLAAVRCTEADPHQRSRALSAAKVVIGQACRFVGQQAIQLHGGMGVTDELDVSHYFRRLMAIEQQGGSTDRHLQAYAAGLG